MKINFVSMHGENGRIRVKGYYKYCSSCSKMIDEYEHLKYDGYCEICYYSRY